MKSYYFLWFYSEILSFRDRKKFVQGKKLENNEDKNRNCLIVEPALLSNYIDTKC